MNSPTHILLGAAVFGRPEQKTINTAAILGAILPDLSLYAMAGYSLFVVGNSAGYVFGTQYFSTEWQDVFKLDNSVFVWGFLLAVGIVRARPWLVAFSGSGLLHIATDFPLHNDDARQHFWPVSDWVFESPISYWDAARFGNTVAVLETGLCVLLMGFLLIRFKSIVSRSIIVICGVPQLAFIAATAFSH
ncbi:MAG: cobalamin biosynthesis protein CobQ [Rhodobacteraceae bacterium]|nr:cobalamin biosynthesis protein CobQ [Paracoccaceae bacterium]